MKNKVLVGFATLMMIAILTGCGKAPQTQIDAVNAAIEEAKNAEAAVYLPDEFAALQNSMNAVMADIETQKGKLFKKFGDAKLKLDETLTQANQLTSSVAAKKEEVKAEVGSMMESARSVIEENKTLITKAPRGKEGAAVLEQIKSEMAAIESSLAEVQTLNDNGSFMDALNKLKAAMESANSINTELKEAIAKVRR